MKSERLEPKYLVQERPEAWGCLAHLPWPPQLSVGEGSLCLQGVSCCGPQEIGEQNELAIFLFLRNRKSREEISVHRPRLQMAVPSSEGTWRAVESLAGMRRRHRCDSCPPTPTGLTPDTWRVVGGDSDCELRSCVPVPSRATPFPGRPRCPGWERHQQPCLCSKILISYKLPLE